MVILNVLYPRTKDSRFDFDYYFSHHMPLVRSRWASMGLEKDEFMRGLSNSDGSPASFALIGLLTFLSQEHLQQAMAEHGEEILADIPNYTNVQPILQISEPV
jgi:uncharacterized protein (TIGR02118 family)